jgi:Leucine-rich repeat (LRR) protein
MRVGPDVHQGYLDLSRLGLNILPPNLPTSVTCLNLDGNFFTDLPQGLPAGLLTLRLDNNGLRRLSGSLPTALRGLYIDRNFLDYLPDTLPASITRISARSNNLGQPTRFVAG